MIYFLPWSWFREKKTEAPFLFAAQVGFLLWIWIALPWRWALMLHCYHGLVFLAILGFGFPNVFGRVVRGHALVVEPVSFTLGFAWGILVPWDPPWFVYVLMLLAGSLLVQLVPKGGFRAIRAWKGWDRMAKGWFQHSLVGEMPDEPCLYAMYPHGVATLSAIVTFALYGRRRKEEEGLVGLATTPPMLHLPFIGPVLAAFGSVPCTRAFITDWMTLRSRHSLLLLPDGHDGILLAGQPSGKVDMHLKRQGFLRLAFQHGLPVVPVFARDEHALIWRWTGFEAVQQWTAKAFHFVFPTLIALPLGTTHYPMRVVVGSKIVARSGESLESFSARFKMAMLGMVKQWTREDERGANVTRLLRDGHRE
jgi:hypothetical protein